MVQIRPISAIRRFQVIVDGKEQGIILAIEGKFLYKLGSKELEFDSFQDASEYIRFEDLPEAEKVTIRAAAKAKADADAKEKAEREKAAEKATAKENADASALAKAEAKAKADVDKAAQKKAKAAKKKQPAPKKTVPVKKVAGKVRKK